MTTLARWRYWYTSRHRRQILPGHTRRNDAYCFFFSRISTEYKATSVRRASMSDSLLDVTSSFIGAHWHRWLLTKCQRRRFAKSIHRFAISGIEAECLQRDNLAHALHSHGFFDISIDAHMFINYAPEIFDNYKDFDTLPTATYAGAIAHAAMLGEARYR